jgi:hypothetical protein
MFNRKYFGLIVPAVLLGGLYSPYAGLVVGFFIKMRRKTSAFRPGM